MNQKEKEKLAELQSKAAACERLTGEEIRLRSELLFKRNKQNINMRLTGYDKYYYAYQCWDYTKHIKANGFNRYKPEDIESISINNSSYYGANITARLSSGGETHIKAFNDKKELLGFIVGYNQAIGEQS
jgi:hypothetical protein